MASEQINNRASTAAAADAADFSALAHDELLSVGERADAVENWLIDNRAEARQFVLDELARARAGSWRDSLVLLAEDTWFDDEADQVRLVDLLLEFAAQRRNDGDADAEPVTRAAIRRAASLLPACEMERLLPFLEPSTVGTSLAALVSLVRIVEVELPVNGQKPLVERLMQLVAKLSDPDVYGRGEVDAMLFSCLLLLAVLDMHRFQQSLEKVSRLARPYLFNHFGEELATLRDGWQEDVKEIGGQRIEAALAVVARLGNESAV